MNALVVDNSRAVRVMVCRLLRELGLDPLEAANGAEGLKQLSQHSPTLQVALVDWNMPVMNGLEFVKAVRAQQAYATLKLMMVTSEGEESVVADAMEAGANEFLMKPFDKNALSEKLGLLGVLPDL